MKELKAKYPKLDRELKAKNKKTVLNCEVCHRTIVGEIEGKRHMRSNKHNFMVRRLKKNQLRNAEKKLKVQETVVV
jgi:hypothetical protein